MMDSIGKQLVVATVAAIVLIAAGLNLFWALEHGGFGYFQTGTSSLLFLVSIFAGIPFVVVGYSMIRIVRRSIALLFATATGYALIVSYVLAYVTMLMAV
jgi:hypothetical protein